MQGIPEWFPINKVDRHLVYVNNIEQIPVVKFYSMLIILVTKMRVFSITIDVIGGFWQD